MKPPLSAREKAWITLFAGAALTFAGFIGCSRTMMSPLPESGRDMSNVWLAADFVAFVAGVGLMITGGIHLSANRDD